MTKQKLMGGRAIEEDFKPVRLEHIDLCADRQPFQELPI